MAKFFKKTDIIKFYTVFKKITCIILINLILFIIFIIICDYYIYNKFIQINNKKLSKYEKFNYKLHTKKDIINEERKIFRRYLMKPQGLNYKNKHCIVVFGCSFVFGGKLLQEQRFHYKLAEALKVPVYNRAFFGGNLQEMWFQVAAEGKKDFIKDVPLADTYVYVMMEEHYKRMYSTFNLINSRKYINYINNKGLLKMEVQTSPLKNILNVSYTYKFLSDQNKLIYLKNPENKNEIVDRAVLYFSESKKKLEELNNKHVNFIVLLYDDIPYENNLRYKLNKQKIITISTKDLANVDLKSEKYIINPDDYHPNEKAWDLLIPLIAQKIKEIWKE